MWELYRKALWNRVIKLNTLGVVIQQCEQQHNVSPGRIHVMMERRTGYDGYFHDGFFDGLLLALRGL